MRNTNVVLAALAASISVLFAAAGARAQPGNPGPASFVDLGDLGIGQTAQSPSVMMAAGQRVWFRFRLTEAVTPLANWLDVDTLLEGSGVVTDNKVALYDSNQNLINQDNDSGGSGTSSSFAAAMSFGGGSGQRLSLTPPGGRISTGVWGTTLRAGVYWACIGASPTTFPDPNPNWDATTSSIASGLVRLKLTTGRVPASTWNEAHHAGGDGGEVPSTAQVVEGAGPLANILTSFGPGARDMFRIRVCNPTNFSATVNCSDDTGGSYGTRLYLFDANGRGVVGVNGSASPTTLTVPASLAAGEYYLAVSTNCGGTNGFAGVPYNAATQFLWDFSAVAANTVILPNGPGSANPVVAYFGRQSDCGGAGGFYAQIGLSGACYVQSGCPADFDGSGETNANDIAVFINAWYAAIVNGGACP